MIKTARTLIDNAMPALLATVLDLTWPLCRARERGVMSPHNTVVRLWDSVAVTGEALEAWVDRVAERRGIDIGNYATDRLNGQLIAPARDYRLRAQR